MTAQQFSDMQEAAMIVLSDLASWWLVMMFAASVVLSLVMVGLGFARFLFSRRVGMSRDYQPIK